MPPTLKQLAAELGLNHSTVGYALSGKGTIRPETRERVRLASERLGYVPNRLARGMKTAKTRTIGLIVPDVVHSPYVEVVQHLFHQIDASGRDLQIGLTEFLTHLEQRSVRNMMAMRVDGLVIKSGYGEWDEVPENDPLRQARAAGLPIVCYSLSLKGSGLPVLHDSRLDCVRLVTQHLVEQGHRELAVLAPVAKPFRHLTALLVPIVQQIAAAAGCRVAVHALEPGEGDSHGMPGEFPNYINQNNPQVALEIGAALFAKAMAAPVRPTAVLGLNDVIAIGAMRAAQARGLRVPDDVAIAGCYRTPLTSFAPLPMTTCDSRPKEYAAALLSLLEAHIDARPDAPLEARVEPVLIPSASTGAFTPPRGVA